MYVVKSYFIGGQTSLLLSQVGLIFTLLVECHFAMNFRSTSIGSHQTH